MTHYIDPVYDNDLRETFEVLANHLTGKLVTVRFSRSLAMNATGEAYQDEHGIYRINIAPGVELQRAYMILLEEAAHIRLHVKERAAPRIAMFTVVDARQVNAQPERKRQEEEAAKLVSYWYDIGERKISKQLRRHTPTEKQRAFMNCHALLDTNWIGA